MNAQTYTQGKFADINGLKLYYEIHGSGFPLVLLHGGGSTIKSNYGSILNQLAAQCQVIAVELQAHGHTSDINRPLSFEQDADDVAALLNYLKIPKANVMGFSNGGTTAIQFAIRHPQLLNKIIIASANYRRDGMPPGFFEGMKNASLEMMPKPLQEAYLEANPDQKGLQKMFDRDVARMLGFRDIEDDKIKGIQSPALIINGDKDVVSAQHALSLSQLIPNARLAILPAGHGDYLGEITMVDKKSKMPELVVAMIQSFLVN